jgi:NADPH:quinone reductase-like Zn-dependent oxidoreductase
VILELVGAPNLPGNLQALSPWGRIMVIRAAAGAEAEVNLGLAMQRRARILTSLLRSRTLEEKALTAPPRGWNALCCRCWRQARPRPRRRNLPAGGGRRV